MLVKGNKTPYNKLERKGGTRGTCFCITGGSYDSEGIDDTIFTNNENEGEHQDPQYATSKAEDNELLSS